MKHYAGLDVSMEETAVWVLDEAGGSVFRGSVSSTPDAIASLLCRMWMDDADFRWSGKQMEARAA